MTEEGQDGPRGLRTMKEWELPTRLSVAKHPHYGADMLVGFIKVTMIGQRFDIQTGTCKLIDDGERGDIQDNARTYLIESVMENEDFVPEEMVGEDGKVHKLTEEERKAIAEDTVSGAELDCGNEVLDEITRGICGDEKIPAVFRDEIDSLYVDENDEPPGGWGTDSIGDDIVWLTPAEEKFLEVAQKAHGAVFRQLAEEKFLEVAQEAHNQMRDTPAGDILGDYRRAVTEIMKRLEQQDFAGTFRKVIPIWAYMRLKYRPKGKGERKAKMIKDLDQMRDWLREHKTEMAESARKLLDKKEGAGLASKGEAKKTIRGKKGTAKARTNPDPGITDELADYYHAVGIDPEIPVDWLIAQGATPEQIITAADQLLTADRIDPPDYWGITAAALGADHHVGVAPGTSPANERPAMRENPRGKRGAPITLKQAKALKSGDHIYDLSRHYKDKMAHAMVVRVNGKPKTWKKDPSRVRVPLKYGFYGPYGYMTENDLSGYSLTEPPPLHPPKPPTPIKREDIPEMEVPTTAIGGIQLAIDTVEKGIAEHRAETRDFDSTPIEVAEKLGTREKYEQLLQQRDELMWRGNPIFKNAKEALKDALNRLTAIEVVESYEPQEPGPTVEESLDSLEEAAKEASGEAPEVTEGVKALEDLQASLIRSDWQQMFDKERREHPTLSEETVKTIVDDHMAGGARENPSVADRAAKRFWEKKNYAGPKALSRDAWLGRPGPKTMIRTGKRRDIVVVRGEPGLDSDPETVAYLLWDHLIASIDHDEQGHEALVLSSAGWRTNLTCDRLAGIIDEGRKHHAILKKFVVSKEDNELWLRAAHRIAHPDPETPWQTTRWERVCALAPTLYHLDEIKGKIPKYTTYIDLEATLKENIDRLTGKAYKPTVEEMAGIPLDTLAEIQLAIDTVEKGIAEHRAETRDFDSTPVEVAEKLGTREKYEQLLQQRDELMWRGNPKLRHTPPNAPDVEVKCPVTGKYTWSCTRCALFKRRKQQFIECKAKKGREYHLARNRDKRGTVWDTYVLPLDQRGAGIGTKAIRGD